MPVIVRAFWPVYLSAFPREHSRNPEAFPSSHEQTEIRNWSSSASSNGSPTVFNKRGNEMQRKRLEEGEKVPQRKHPSTVHLLLFKPIDLFVFFSSSFESGREAGFMVTCPFLSFSISGEFISEADLHHPYIVPTTDMTAEMCLASFQSCVLLAKYTKIVKCNFILRLKGYFVGFIQHLAVSYD